jgi:hypothetical protein
VNRRSDPIVDKGPDQAGNHEEESDNQRLHVEDPGCPRAVVFLLQNSDEAIQQSPATHLQAGVWRNCPRKPRADAIICGDERPANSVPGQPRITEAPQSND